MRRALDNLLDNAFKYSPEDTRIEIQVKATSSNIVFGVKDRGIGVSDDDLPLLFESFFRTERSRSRKAGGTGLGLTLCKKIAEKHKGSITAVQRDGGGMVFELTIPFA